MRVKHPYRARREPLRDGVGDLRLGGRAVRRASMALATAFACRARICRRPGARRGGSSASGKRLNRSGNRHRALGEGAPPSPRTSVFPAAFGSSQSLDEVRRPGFKSSGCPTRKAFRPCEAVSHCEADIDHRSSNGSNGSFYAICIKWTPETIITFRRRALNDHEASFAPGFDRPFKRQLFSRKRSSDIEVGAGQPLNPLIARSRARRSVSETGRSWSDATSGVRPGSASDAMPALTVPRCVAPSRPAVQSARC